MAKGVTTTKQISSPAVGHQGVLPKSACVFYPDEETGMIHFFRITTCNIIIKILYVYL